MVREKVRAFTILGLQALKPKDARYIAWDPANTGFGLRVSPHGHKAFVYAYRFDGRFRMKTLGAFDTDGTKGGLTLKAALRRYHADAAKVGQAAEARAYGEAPAVELDPGAVKT